MAEFTGFNENSYLTTTSFMNYLNNVKTGSVCNILPDVRYFFIILGNLSRCQILLSTIISRRSELGPILSIKLYYKLFVN